MSINDSLVENLEQMRLSSGFTKAELARELGVSQTRLYHIQTKRRNIGMDMFKRILRVFPGFADLLKRLVTEDAGV